MNKDLKAKNIVQHDSEKKQNLAFQNLRSNICSICLQPLGFKMAPYANLLDCGHSFCMADLKVWLSRNTTCPLCKYQILNVQQVQPYEVSVQQKQCLSALQTNEADKNIQMSTKRWNIEEIVSSQTRNLNKKQDKQKEPGINQSTINLTQILANFDCLDHFYFKNQIQKLCQMRTRIQTQKFLKREGNGVHVEWIALQCMKTRLQQIKQDNSKFVHFNPNELMIELTGLAQLLNDIKAGKLQRDDEDDDDDEKNGYEVDKNLKFDQQKEYKFEQFILTPQDAFGKSKRSVNVFQNGKFKKAKKNNQFFSLTQQKLEFQSGSIQFTSNKSLKKKKKKNKNKKGIELKVW